MLEFQYIECGLLEIYLYKSLVWGIYTDKSLDWGILNKQTQKRKK